MAEHQGCLFPEVPVEYPPAMHPQHRVMLESQSEHWCTSRDVLDLVRSFDEIGFDPFSNPYSLVGAKRSVALPENSLVIPWPTDCLVYANPPYGDALPDCAEKIAMEARRGCEIIALVPARVDTEWWNVKMGVNLWLAWRGRMKFLETVEALKLRHEDQTKKALALGVKPPVRPRVKMVGEHLCEGQSATFASALVYFGPRQQRFIKTFRDYGTIWSKT